MLKIIGIVIILSACVLYGNILTNKAEEKVLVIEALRSFVMYIKTSIKTARVPLADIFSSFNNDVLDHYVDFVNELRAEGLHEAINSIKNSITTESFEAMVYLEKNLGGIDIETQTNVCSYVEEKLTAELDTVKNTFNNKKKMYRMLPLLAGLSVIILIV